MAGLLTFGLETVKVINIPDMNLRFAINRNLNKDIEHNKKILSKSEKGREVIEKYQLISNISTLSEEIDKYSEINNDEINVIELGKNEKGVNKLKIIMIIAMIIMSLIVV